MAVELSVKDVRQALLAAGGAVGDGDAATLLLGRLFHEVFADLVSRDARRSGIRVIVEAGPDPGAARERLLAHTYQALVGPRLARYQPQLNETTAAVLTFWQAVQNLCRWLTDLVLDLARSAGTARWEAIVARFAAEEDLACELRAPGWTDAVRLTGTVDSLVRRPAGTEFCAIELKLGRGRPDVDLGQVALYRLIAARSSGAGGALALLRFSAALEETVITAAQVADAEEKLVELIGRLAGVLPRPAPPPAPPPPASAAYAELAQRIVRAYREYGRPVELPDPPIVGPRFVRFEVRLGKGVSVDHVERLTREVGIRAEIATPPLVSTIAGRLYIDVARPDPQVVPFSVVRAALGPTPRGSARLPIGVDPAGKLLSVDLCAPVTAHVLVAGSAGSGKSEWLRMAIAGLMVANTPDTLRLALVDPKMSAFSDLRRSRWLLGPGAFWVPGETVEIVDFLDDLIHEMEGRYRTFNAVRADDLAGYLAAGAPPMARIVCFCDEYYDLIASGDRRARKEVETRVSRLAAKGRAAGIHLVIATQQASREVIKGTLDANMSCRVGLRVAKDIESRLLLGDAGAELLTGYGDLLYRDVGQPVRLQAPYLSPDERRALFSA